MSLLYKNPEDIKYIVDIDKNLDNITFTFGCDGGKFGTYETLADYTISVFDLLKLLKTTENDKQTN